jgi:mRNA interferase MazF
LLCPITRRSKGYPFEVHLPNGFQIGGVILADQVKSLDWRVRNVEAVARLPADTVEEALAKLRALL